MEISEKSSLARVLYKCRRKKEFYNESDRKVTFSQFVYEVRIFNSY